MIQKKYKLHSSPLYRIRSIHVLAKLLLIDPRSLRRVEEYAKSNPKKAYHVFLQEPKKREIQQPVHPLLVLIHKRMKEFLSQIETPTYLFSSKRGLSYIDNARMHISANYLQTMDINKFYASTRAEAVFQFFLYDLEMASDLARMLTNLCTYDSYKIPTGSSISQILAFWAYHRVFDKVNDIMESIDISFSLYVDDMTFSSSHPIPKDLHCKIEEQLKQKWLRFKPCKLHRYFPQDSKTVTGCIITQDHRLEAPNALKAKAIKGLQVAFAPSKRDGKDLQRALGITQSIQQIDSSIFKESHRRLKREIQLLRKANG